jgi:hypothetical protein
MARKERSDGYSRRPTAQVHLAQALVDYWPANHPARAAVARITPKLPAEPFYRFSLAVPDGTSREQIVEP